MPGRARSAPALRWPSSAGRSPTEPDDDGVDDDLLRLIFTCCHPSLAPEARLALALRTLCQLSVAQVAAALLTTETAMARRLTRTKQKIAVAHIPYATPAAAELPARLAGVCGVVHAMYTAGHAPLGGDAVVDVDLCAEAVRLARLLVATLPDEPMPAAVLALLLLTEARRPARVDEAGDVVMLADQDRTRWDALLVAEGAAHSRGACGAATASADPYQLQAAVGARARPCPAATRRPTGPRSSGSTTCCSRWPRAPRPSWPAAVAVAERDGPESGLRALEGLPDDVRVRGVRSELLARAGHWAEAAAAAELRPHDALTGPERRFRLARRAEWLSRAGSGHSSPRMSARS